MQCGHQQWLHTWVPDDNVVDTNAKVGEEPEQDDGRKDSTGNANHGICRQHKRTLRC
jgi:hypothetical protein